MRNTKCSEKPDGPLAGRLLRCEDVPPSSLTMTSTLYNACITVAHSAFVAAQPHPQMPRPLDIFIGVRDTVPTLSGSFLHSVKGRSESGLCLLSTNEPILIKFKIILGQT